MKAKLSPAETEIFELIGQGKSRQQIAHVRCRALSTVNNQCLVIRLKLGLSNRDALVAEAVRHIENIEKNTIVLTNGHVLP